ncbi:hypothetical protein BCR34DRAFT_197368 [Clohesyomyces aquaticus]|uniref:Uncharacterized protein n=1 Tax=Clohesyomyces aquaticus TaxID=1231657 RepID=A0A1Y1ZXR3_9PLEO|nr:hypothetical protein BCR34DRAFT_197368 [Clohesyomyces aquaticus]
MPSIPGGQPRPARGPSPERRAPASIFSNANKSTTRAAAGCRGEVERGEHIREDGQVHGHLSGSRPHPSLPKNKALLLVYTSAGGLLVGHSVASGCRSDWYLTRSGWTAPGYVSVSSKPSKSPLSSSITTVSVGQGRLQKEPSVSGRASRNHAQRKEQTPLLLYRHRPGR